MLYFLYKNFYGYPMKIENVEWPVLIVGVKIFFISNQVCFFAKEDGQNNREKLKHNQWEIESQL